MTRENMTINDLKTTIEALYQDFDSKSKFFELFL